jgi:hypothetical protein
MVIYEVQDQGKEYALKLLEEMTTQDSEFLPEDLDVRSC